MKRLRRPGPPYQSVVDLDHFEWLAKLSARYWRSPGVFEYSTPDRAHVRPRHPRRRRRA